MPVYTDTDDLIARFDARTITQLASDTGTSIALSDVATDTKVLTALTSAEGQVVAALLVGGRYTEDELAALTGIHLAFLQDIICEIAMLFLMRRRPKLDPKLFEHLKEIRDTHLKALQDGKAIFGGDDSSSDISAARVSVDGISYNDLVQNDSVRIRKSRYFPDPSLPIGRQ